MLPIEFEEAAILRGSFVTGLSDDEFFRFCQENDSVRVERTATHEIVIMPPAGNESSRSSGSVYFQLTLWAQQTGSGYTFESSAGFSLPDGSVLSPNASWMNTSAWESLTDEQRQKFSPVCPDFVVEVKSPSDRIKTLQAKMEQWLANGAKLGFLLHVEAETAYLYRPGQPVEIIQGFLTELSGEPILPGFRLNLRKLRK